MKFTILDKIVLFLALLQVTVTVAQRDIYDPRGIFCGKVSCYDVLNVTRKAPAREIKRAYRKLSVQNHPDKNNAKNATKIFNRIAKAYEVLDGNESRPLFDYYLDHPRDYFKVSGHHYLRNLPKSDVRLILLVVALLLSGFFWVMQNQKYENAVKSVKAQMANSIKGGNQAKQISDLQRHAEDLYNEHIKAAIAGGDKKAGKMLKMLKDPVYLTFVDEVLSGLKIEGGCRKPELNDLFIVQAAMFPLYVYNYVVTYHRRYISDKPLADDEKRVMASESLGPGTWENQTPSEQAKLIQMEIWKSSVRAKWIEDQGELEEGEEKLSKRAQKQQKKYASKNKDE
mmetsp:Transcript_22324/g.21569  ORF Transcript_22324/g.21569 Transcript_22324/m.21569 type:complete len:341 (-) Transcript_22324:106-1128(-)|eukprot:CAMPEP_0119052262 /NCGR_PEP_ID=MMETSP1177-20130426/73618_1 /TAXON_ID=2985 /ORGANISM="Ochromonas sp, Strain CCMP1899" /LENGTH=340 /DNA_ID=CAMNT_0007031775 /DNA_START=45 /DNA_END=1067 /DNA_ORIENTATION=-